jgi:hypothetical protein
MPGRLFGALDDDLHHIHCGNDTRTLADCQQAGLFSRGSSRKPFAHSPINPISHPVREGF